MHVKDTYRIYAPACVRVLECPQTVFIPLKKYENKVGMETLQDYPTWRSIATVYICQCHAVGV